MFTCKTPYVSTALVVLVEVLTDTGVFSTSINNEFEFIETPYLSKATPYMVPLNVTRVFTLTGSNFNAAYTYYCQFKKHLTFQNDTIATYIASTSLSCKLPSYNFVTESKYLNIRLVMVDSSNTFKYVVPGIARAHFYKTPYITKF